MERYQVENSLLNVISDQLIYRWNKITITIQTYLCANWQVFSKSYMKRPKIAIAFLKKSYKNKIEGPILPAIL